ncbi:hypothetical protein [Deinococcus sonorensis]|uniref:Tetratricopeptide repeat protein n=2 Tax=Deinococcus sonorensis TaxID=309891 RepID=A0AAU7UBX5_9DEIO
MNYAASLAVVVILTFFFPLTVRIGVAYGLPRTLATVALAAVLTFVAATLLIRWQVARYRQAAESVEEARRQVNLDPQNPRAYFVGGEHLASLLLRLGRRREAAEMIDRYARLGGARESEIVALQTALSQAERRQRRGTHLGRGN